ncbi:MAG: epoxyqueuosine reductase [Deltaproteobacteria bacterium]|jgi:epoxyqueuosine reductase|nr:epoxyqueuosine reductase [Deltaproteobacteria bacterium]
MTLNRGTQIIEKAKELGATMAGIASVELLKKAPSQQLIRKIGMVVDEAGSLTVRWQDRFSETKWPAKAGSVLVIAVSHPEDKPELDVWDPGGSSPGTRMLLRINRKLSKWIEETLGIKTHKLPYDVEHGGIFLKEAAVLSGLGCIGKNNLVITAELGSRIRLRAMLLEDELTPTGPIDFDPCKGCEEFCRKACLRNAYEKNVFSSVETGVDSLPGRDGYFNRANCIFGVIRREGILDEIDDYSQDDDLDIEKERRIEGGIEYCRICELACPVGSK